MKYEEDNKLCNAALGEWSSGEVDCLPHNSHSAPGSTHTLTQQKQNNKLKMIVTYDDNGNNGERVLYPM
jgi:hypothetical protein